MRAAASADLLVSLTPRSPNPNPNPYTLPTLLLILKRYCPSHYRAWLLAAHKTMDTSSIFSHLLSRARPIFGANADAAGSSSKRSRVAQSDEVTTKPKKQSAANKRKSALTRVISKNNRQRRRQA